MEVHAAVAKINRFTGPEGGDTVEMIERPNGGVSIVLADGKAENKASKAVSIEVVHRIIGLIGSGVQDGAAVKTIGKALYKENSGLVTTSLNILSCDLQTNTIVVTRCNPLPVMVIQDSMINCLTTESNILGKSATILSSIYQIPLEGEFTVIMYSDGIHNAGSSEGLSFEICTAISALFQEQEPTAQEAADFLLAQAILMDRNQPEDDMCVVVMQIIPHLNNPIRRLSVRLPINR